MQRMAPRVGVPAAPQLLLSYPVRSCDVKSFSLKNINYI